MIDASEVYTDKDFYEYPTIELFQEALKELRNTDLTGYDKKRTAETIFKYMSVIPSLIGKYGPEKFNCFNFYRVRLNINQEKEDLNLIQTYSYPLPVFCNDNGRANLKNKSVFYASHSALTSIMESKPKVGDTGYLSCWVGNTNREMKSGILLPRNLNINNEWYVLAEDAYHFADGHLDKVAMTKSNFFHEALNFISGLFLTEKFPYPITSWISTELLYGSAWKDFLIYPSFVNMAYSCNLALHPNVADQYLKFVKVIRFKVLDISNDRFSISTGRVGEIKQNNMQWRNASSEELDFALFPSFI